jgi:hypothetical protein
MSGRYLSIQKHAGTSYVWDIGEISVFDHYNHYNPKPVQ